MKIKKIKLKAGLVGGALVLVLAMPRIVLGVETENAPVAEGIENNFVIEEIKQDDTIAAFSDQPEYMLFDNGKVEGKEDMPAFRKTVSVLGDSIATFQYYSSWNNYCDYYTEEHMSVHDTWWMHYIDTHDMRLGVNDSLGSSRVAWDEKENPIPSYLGPDKAMASDKRILNLGANGTPDVILFFGGTNDLGVTDLGEFNPENPSMEIKTFADAYQTAILKMKKYYPEVRIVTMTPYYWPHVSKETVDAYCDVILEICEYYEVPCTDLRKAGLRIPQDMFGPGYDHPNEHGMKKMWHLLEKGRPEFISNGIYVMQNNENGIQAGMTLSTPEFYESVTYQWNVRDVETDELVLQTEKSSSNWLIWKPEKSGKYSLQCIAENAFGETTEYIQEIESLLPATEDEIKFGGITWQAAEDYLDVGVSYIGDDKKPEFKWMCYNLAKGEWSLIQDWSESNWVSWKDEPGTYWLNVKGRTGDRKSMFEHTMAFQYYPGEAKITGTYAGWQENEILLGCASNLENARYEFKIYDLDKQKWFWGSGRTGAWVTWKPNSGNYWLHYELYSMDNRLLDTKTYCFAV